MENKFKGRLRVLIFLLLLLLQNITCEHDKKQEFGDQLAAAFKTEGLKLCDAHISTLKELCQKLLAQGKPTAEQAKILKQDLLYFEQLNPKKSLENTTDFVEKLRAFVKGQYTKYLRSYTTEVENYEANPEFIIKTMRQGRAETEKQLIDFAMAIYDSWTKLYGTLNQEDFDEHEEYKSINELMQGVSRTEGQGSVFLDALRAMIEFFDYKGWDFITEMSSK